MPSSTDSPEYKGKVTAYDSPIYIADAALYLKETKPSLGINDPYSLTDQPARRRGRLLKNQNENIGEYWSDYTKEVQAFESGTSVVGTTWQVIANLINADKKVKVETVLPKEGATGWSDTWMVSTKAKHPNCMYKWMDWITSPKVNAQVAEWFGEAPAQTKACERDHRQELLRHLPRHRRGTTREDRILDDPEEGLRRRQRHRLHPVHRLGERGSRSGASRTAAQLPLHEARARLALLLSVPLLWLVVMYLGSIAVMLVSAFWTVDDFTGAVVHTFTLDNITRPSSRIRCSVRSPLAPSGGVT